MGYNMYAYCDNNPTNHVDLTGTLTSKADGFQQLGQLLGDMLGNWIKETPTAITEEREKINSGTVSYSSNGAGNGAHIQNSHEIRRPLVMYEYIGDNRGNEVEGTTTGVVVEWVVHNIAYSVGDALGIDSLTIPAAHLDVGKTIFSDRREGFGFQTVMSLGMQIAYTIFIPYAAIHDMSVETGRWDFIYVN